jgi:hypothetical protein
VDQNIYNTFDFISNASGQWNSWVHSIHFSFEFREEQAQGTEGLENGARTNDVTSFSARGLLDFTENSPCNGAEDWIGTTPTAWCL